MLLGNGGTVQESNMSKSKSKPMTTKAAKRIQSHADRTSSNSGFKARAQAAAAKQSGSGSKLAGKK